MTTIVTIAAVFVLEAFGAQDLSLKINPLESADGTAVFAKLKVPQQWRNAEVHGKTMGKTIPFFKVNRNHYGAIIGIPYQKKAGQENLVVQLKKGKRTAKVNGKFTVKSGNYKSEVLTVDRKKVQPPKKVWSRIKKENREIGKTYRRLTKRKMWDGPFKAPLMRNRVTSPFGTARVYNGKKRGFHKGVDFKAAVGTPIYAPAAGIVTIAKDLYFTGNTVFIDHGYGVITLYGHMSKMSVKAGQKVKVGQKLGYAGMTGRVTGPHLHWSAIVQKVKVNPLSLTKAMIE